ncbi:uncharacterized protein LOC124950614 [Vespa velutina]|uniref:uncharacterized protein LOC124950614 n=1 Tax=Vespa velutina TaxID=202808 RepID=UPI001FB49E8D|nr:uncharacterized protein LOC124950614 [Vespa velutina]
MSIIPRISYEEELRKNPELKESDIEILKEWCKKQPHLPKITDSELALFLHSNYYRLEPTKTTIDTFYTVRTHVPEFFSNRDPLGSKSLRQIMKVVADMPLEMTTKEGHKIVFAKLLDTDPSHYVYNDGMKYFSMVIDYWLYSEGTGIGHVILIDMESVSFGHAGRLSPMGLKKFLYYLQEALPVRLKGLHFMNTTAVMDIILNMMKPFMKKELMDVLHVHTTLESVAKFIPLEALPTDVGGKAGFTKDLHEKYIKKIENHRSWFLEDEMSGRVNEALRPGKSKNVTDLFGVEGSFKKLEKAFNKNPNLKESDLQIIRAWLDKQPHLPKIEDIYLILFLNSNYYQLERTKTTIDNFYTIRTHVPEFFSNRDPFLKDIRTQFSVTSHIPLKKMTNEGYQIIFGNMIDPEPSHYIFYENIKYFFMVVELANIKTGPTNGLVYVGDVQNLSLGHIGRINLMGIKKFLYFIQEAAPIRLKQIHIINSTPAMEVLLNMCKPFMKKELYEMIHFSTLESLEKFLPVDALPNEIGGKGGNLKDLINEQTKLLDENREWFLKEEITKRNMTLQGGISFEEELKKNPELKEDDVRALKEWCQKQPHLPKISDSEIALFLHSNYYRMEPTKNTIDTYYTIRTHVPEFFSNRDPISSKDLRKAFQTVSNLVLDKTTNDGYKIIYGRLIDIEPSHYVYNDGMKYLNMVIDLWLHEEGTSKGHVILFDTKNVAFGHVGRLNPMGLKKFLYYLQEALPVRLKGFHFMNTSPVMDVILNMMKPFMKKELMDMFHMHSTMETLAKFIPLEILPNESGGQAGPLKDLNDAQVKKLDDNRAWFQEEERICRVNESLRPGKGKTATDLFGVEGSFKKLEID